MATYTAMPPKGIHWYFGRHTGFETKKVSRRAGIFEKKRTGSKSDNKCDSGNDCNDSSYTWLDVYLDFNH